MSKINISDVFANLEDEGVKDPEVAGGNAIDTPPKEEVGGGEDKISVANIFANIDKEDSAKEVATDKPQKAPKEDAKKKDPLESLYRGVSYAETGSEGDPWIRTKYSKPTSGGLYSSAYGPRQLTMTLAKGYLENHEELFDEGEKEYLNKFVEQGRKMLKASKTNPNDPVYGFGGTGVLRSEEDKELYDSVTKKILKQHVIDAGGDVEKAVETWRGESSEGDPEYFSRFKKGAGGDIEGIEVPEAGGEDRQTYAEFTSTGEKVEKTLSPIRTVEKNKPEEFVKGGLIRQAGRTAENVVAKSARTVLPVGKAVYAAMYGEDYANSLVGDTYDVFDETLMDNAQEAMSLIKKQDPGLFRFVRKNWSKSDMNTVAERIITAAIESGDTEKVKEFTEYKNEINQNFAEISKNDNVMQRFLGGAVGLAPYIADSMAKSALGGFAGILAAANDSRRQFKGMQISNLVNKGMDVEDIQNPANMAAINATSFLASSLEVLQVGSLAGKAAGKMAAVGKINSKVSDAIRKGLVEKAFKDGGKRAVAKLIQSKGGQVLGKTSMESFEEFSQALLTTMSEEYVGGGENPYKEALKQGAEEGLYSMALFGVVGGAKSLGGIALNAKSEYKAGEEMSKAREEDAKAQEEAQDAMEGFDTETGDLAEGDVAWVDETGIILEEYAEKNNLDLAQAAEDFAATGDKVGDVAGGISEAVYNQAIEVTGGKPKAKETAPKKPVQKREGASDISGDEKPGTELGDIGNGVYELRGKEGVVFEDEGEKIFSPFDDESEIILTQDDAQSITFVEEGLGDRSGREKSTSIAGDNIGSGVDGAEFSGESKTNFFYDPDSKQARVYDKQTGWEELNDVTVYTGAITGVNKDGQKVRIDKRTGNTQQVEQAKAIDRVYKKMIDLESEGLSQTIVDAEIGGNGDIVSQEISRVENQDPLVDEYEGYVANSSKIDMAKDYYSLFGVKPKKTVKKEDLAVEIVEELYGKDKGVGKDGPVTSDKVGKKSKETGEVKPSSVKKVVKKPKRESKAKQGELEAVAKDTQGVPKTEVKPKKGEAHTMPSAEINIDPDRFQYKSIEGGVDKKFLEKPYNKELAGAIDIWKDPKDGKNYVINGHHRLALAKKNNIDNVNVIEIEAKSASEARLKGALKNIAENSGSNLDAAKVFREYKGDPQKAIQEYGISMSDKKVENGLALANLSNDVFGTVAQFPELERSGIVIGQETKDPAIQSKLIKKADDVTLGTLREMARDEAVAKDTKVDTGQGSLFGDDTIAVEDIAKMRSDIKSSLKRSGKTLKGALKGKDILESADNIINKDKTKAEGERADALYKLYDTVANKSETSNKIVSKYAKQVTEGRISRTEAVSKATKEVVDNIEAIVEDAGFGKDAAKSITSKVADSKTDKKDEAKKAVEKTEKGKPKQKSTKDQFKLTKKAKEKGAFISEEDGKLFYHSTNTDKALVAEIVEAVPEGWSVVPGGSAPVGHVLISNGSPLRPGYKKVIVKKSVAVENKRGKESKDAGREVTSPAKPMGYKGPKKVRERRSFGKGKKMSKAETSKFVSAIKNVFPITQNLEVMFDDSIKGSGEIRYYDGATAVLLNPNAIGNENTLTVMHEMIGHYGVGEMIKSDLDMQAKLVDMFRNDDTGIRDMVNKVYADKNEQERFQEWLAYSVEDVLSNGIDSKGNKTGFLKNAVSDRDNMLVKVYKTIKQWLHRMLSKLKGVSQSERDTLIQDILVELSNKQLSAQDRMAALQRKLEGTTGDLKGVMQRRTKKEFTAEDYAKDLDKAIKDIFGKDYGKASSDNIKKAAKEGDLTAVADGITDVMRGIALKDPVIETTTTVDLVNKYNKVVKGAGKEYSSPSKLRPHSLISAEKYDNLSDAMKAEMGGDFKPIVEKDRLVEKYGSWEEASKTSEGMDLIERIKDFNESVISRIRAALLLRYSKTKAEYSNDINNATEEIVNGLSKAADIRKSSQILKAQSAAMNILSKVSGKEMKPELENLINPTVSLYDPKTGKSRVFNKDTAQNRWYYEVNGKKKVLDIKIKSHRNIINSLENRINKRRKLEGLGFMKKAKKYLWDNVTDVLTILEFMGVEENSAMYNTFYKSLDAAEGRKNQLNSEISNRQREIYNAFVSDDGKTKEQARKDKIDAERSIMSSRFTSSGVTAVEKIPFLDKRARVNGQISVDADTIKRLFGIEAEVKTGKINQYTFKDKLGIEFDVTPAEMATYISIADSSAGENIRRHGIKTVDANGEYSRKKYIVPSEVEAAFRKILNTDYRLLEKLRKDFKEKIVKEIQEGINSTSRIVEGINIATDENYFVTKRIQPEVDKAVEREGDFSIGAFESGVLDPGEKGILKSRVTNTNPFAIGDWFQVQERYYKQANSYIAVKKDHQKATVVLAKLENRLKEMGYDEEFKIIRETIDRVGGKVKVSDPTGLDKFIGTAMKNMGMANLSVNPSTTLKQLGSMGVILAKHYKNPTEMMSVLGQAFRAESGSLKLNTELTKDMNKFAVLKQRAEYVADTGVMDSVNTSGRRLVHSITGRQDLLPKAMQLTVGGGDRAVMRMLYKSATIEANKRKFGHSVEKRDFVENYIRETIHRSQPDSSQIARSRYRSSDNPLIKAIFMFSSLSEKLYRRGIMSIVNLQRGHNKKQAVKELMSTFLFASATNSIINVLFSRWQGFDDDEEGYATMLKDISNDLVANTLGLVPFAQAVMGTSIAAMTDTYNFKPGHPAFEALKDGQRAKEKARQAIFVEDSGVTANEAFSDMSTYMLEWIIGAPTSAVKKYKRIYRENFMD